MTRDVKCGEASLTVPVVVSAASSSSGDRCDRTKERPAPGRTEEPLDHEQRTLPAGYL